MAPFFQLRKAIAGEKSGESPKRDTDEFIQHILDVATQNSHNLHRRGEASQIRMSLIALLLLQWTGHLIVGET